MTEPFPDPAEVMLQVTRSSLRSGRLTPGQVVAQQLKALGATGYKLQPELEDGGAALLLGTAKKAFWSGHFRPGDVIELQLRALAEAGHAFEFTDRDSPIPCDFFVWGPNSFDSCDECGMSFWLHGEGDAPGANTRDA